MSLLLMTDVYKVDHRRQYPRGTTHVYSNFTARTSRVEGQTHVPLVGLQYFLDQYFGHRAQQWFERPRQSVLGEYRRTLDDCLPGNDIGVEHIGALHDLGYLPIEVCAVPEGTRVPLRVPMFTVENTHPAFFWLTNYFETLMSAELWQACTSAATAQRYREILDAAAVQTTGSTAGVEWQAHDFSMRGMAGVEAAALSGLGHLLSFQGTDCIPAVDMIRKCYSSQELIGASVPATEHSVMCAGGQEDELETFRRLLKLYPAGVVSIVSDTWDLWHVLTAILPQLKAEIMARPGKLVIRPDSGDPADILCGELTTFGHGRSPQEAGVVELLWNLFGGTVNARGYRVLDSHIGAIYGDSITTDRAVDICNRLADKGFASTNVVFGVGSYTYQYVTRDTNGFAMKATWARVNGEERMLSKNPVTDSGVKKSARGRLAVVRNHDTGALELVDDLMLWEQQAMADVNLLKPVWRNGRFLQKYTLDDLRRNIRA
jgi:nicotinamide phosphoribosyltransferase